MAFLLHQLLSESAARHPDGVAVMFEGQTLTYARLERESNRLAHQLLSLGVAKGDRVGIHMRRGIESILAAHGILKSGAAYVPIDPLSPPSRLGYIVGKCGMRVLVTLREKLPNVEQAFASKDSPLESIVVIDGVEGAKPRDGGSTRLVDWREVPEGSDERAPEAGLIDSDVAYVLFTSGSTGNPKGVVITHLNALTFVTSAGDFFGIRQADRVCNISPLHFDMSVLEIYLALKAAAALVVVPETSAMFPVKLAEVIAKNRITVWNSVPSALSLLATLANLADYDLSSLRLVLFAGEVFPLKYLRRLQDAAPAARFCNMYGQTEANSSTYYWVDRVPPEATGALPIGRPLPNFEVFAIDEEGRRVQPGQEGELYVRAHSVALGYWDDEEKTAKAFVRNPLRPDLDERVYRTGDLVRLDPDGNYAFLGRRDHMIKSRGYRIEIGEIETVLSDHPDVKHAVVIPIPDELVGNRISAIVVPARDGAIKKEDVARHCHARLPKYMVPEIIEIHEELPTTSSGKVNRRELSGIMRERHSQRHGGS
jgi:amino acid adenylation domain-containing protein